MNSQNIWIWPTENPHAPYETTSNPVKNGVWFAVYCHRIIQSIFFENTVKLDHYIGIAHGSNKRVQHVIVAQVSMDELPLLFGVQILKDYGPHTCQICHHQIFFSYGAT
jgi:hypothetical protein